MPILLTAALRFRTRVLPRDEPHWSSTRTQTQSPSKARSDSVAVTPRMVWQQSSKPFVLAAYTSTAQLTSIPCPLFLPQPPRFPGLSSSPSPAYKPLRRVAYIQSLFIVPGTYLVSVFCLISLRVSCVCDWRYFSIIPANGRACFGLLYLKLLFLSPGFSHELQPATCLFPLYVCIYCKNFSFVTWLACCFGLASSQ